MSKSKSTGIDKSHGFVTKPTGDVEQSLPINGGNYGHAVSKKSTYKPKPGIPTGVPSRPKS